MLNQHAYVAIDLETTGLNAQSDAIIEIGAVRFTCSPYEPDDFTILERFVTFVNPGRPIPLRIQQLTGIKDKDVINSPTLEEVRVDVLAFVGDDARYLVAHNAGFDSSFLRAGGIDFHCPVQDTFELATILLPGESSYSLGELTKSYQIELSEAHRALDDAEAAARLYHILLRQLPSLHPGIRRILLQCGQQSTWEPIYLLREFDPGTVRNAAKDFAQPHAKDEATPATATDACDGAPWDDVAKYYESGGCIHKILGDQYEYRDGQVSMSERVATALQRGDHLLIEAGTGTGKTLAYLLPAALWAMRMNTRVTIATNTIALQEQILDKDMPFVRRLLEHAHNVSPRATLLKGRSNYLCTRRLYLWYRNRQLSPLELRLLARVLVWLQSTQTGDVSELFMPTNAERAIWMHMTSDGGVCSEDRCSAECSSDGDVLGTRYRDFFLLAHQQAEDAHIVVVNHALLMADMDADGRLLPPYENLVVDEAHRLEEAATEQLSFNANWRTLSRWLGDLHRTGELSQQLQEGCRRSGDLECENSVINIAAAAVAAEQEVPSFANRLSTILMQHSSIQAGAMYSQRIAIDRAFRSQPAWSGLEIEWDRASSYLEDLIERLEALASALSSRQWWRSEPYSSYLSELRGITKAIDDSTDNVNQIIYGTGEIQNGNRVAWAEIDERASEVTLSSAPLFVSDIVESCLIHKKRSVILTGATLRTGSGFAFIRDRLGLWDVEASTVPSPFNYEENALLYMPSDMPDPRNVNYQHAVERAIISAATGAEGSTVALFTSYAQLRVTADAIRVPLDRRGITVLQQGSSSRRRLLREFRDTDKAVLLGTRSFWEGIDLPGDELLCLLIVRLPFAVPSDPLVAARTADLDNSFRDYTLPDAILRFRQGFGRLVRRSTDRGVVVVLDSRVWRMEYGQSFLESLPRCKTKHAPLDCLEAEVRAWLKQGKVRTNG